MATYQRLVNKIYFDLIRKIVELYMDDMLVKSLKANEHIRHLEEVSQILRRYITQLNPPKCAFGITSRKFLGYKVNQRGIKLIHIRSELW